MGEIFLQPLAGETQTDILQLPKNNNNNQYSFLFISLLCYFCLSQNETEESES